LWIGADDVVNAGQLGAIGSFPNEQGAALAAEEN
jgi:hypothetical protein